MVIGSLQAALLQGTGALPPPLAAPRLATTLGNVRFASDMPMPVARQPERPRVEVCEVGDKLRDPGQAFWWVGRRSPEILFIQFG